MKLFRSRIIPQIYQVVVSSIRKCMLGMDIPKSWSSTHIRPLTCQIRAIIVGKAKWKPLNCCLLPARVVNQNQYHSPWGMVEMSATLKYLKNARTAIPIISTLNSLVYLPKNWVDPGECELQQFKWTALIMTAGVHVTTSLEHVNMWTLIWWMHSFLSQSVRWNRYQCIFLVLPRAM